MKWYWILLIIIAAVLIGWLIYKAAKPKTITASLTKTTTTPSTTVASGNGSTVATTANPDGTKTVALSQS